jgi:hypothetical protein
MGYRGCDKDDEVEPKLPRIEKNAQSRFQVKLLGGFDFKGATCIQSDIHIHSDPDPK